MRLHRCVISLLIAGSHLTLNAGWLERKAEGWAWYENDKERQRETESPKAPENVESATEILAKEKKQLEELLAEAMINPTNENAMKYMLAQRKWLEQAGKFSQSWGQVLLQNPEMDPTATTFATSQYGRQLQKAIAQDETENFIKAIAKEYGLFFFYEGNSKISNAFAMVVRAFVSKYNWKAMGIATDGIQLEEIENSRLDNGVAEKMNINVFPALIAVNPKTQEVFPIAFGLQSLSQMENNIMVQFNNFTQEVR